LLSNLGLDFLDPQPEMAGINTKEVKASTKTGKDEADGGAGTPVLDSFFMTLFP
jgi:hypothetical protein